MPTRFFFHRVQECSSNTTDPSSRLLAMSFEQHQIKIAFARLFKYDRRLPEHWLAMTKAPDETFEKHLYHTLENFPDLPCMDVVGEAMLILNLSYPECGRLILREMVSGELTIPDSEEEPTILPIKLDESTKITRARKVVEIPELVRHPSHE